jgi:hydrogenase expression/formation protein HypE
VVRVIGKLPPELLEKLIFSAGGIKDSSVLVGPAVGEDAAVIDLGGGQVLVAHSDSITAATSLIGWLGVIVVSNDIAVTGARPKWFLLNIHLPPEGGLNLLKTITGQIRKAVNHLRASVVGGHTEFTPNLSKPLLTATAIGVTSKSKFIRTGGAKPGDVVIMTKTAGLEGTSILATDFKDLLLKKGIASEIIRRAETFIEKVSVVEEALALAEAGIPNSMHDPTEGGVLGGLSEIAFASKTTVEVFREKVSVAPETETICRILELDPLRLISSGVLLATLPRIRAGEALKILKDVGVEAGVIGNVKEFNGHLVELHEGGSVSYIDDVVVTDELVRFEAETPS